MAAAGAPWAQQIVVLCFWLLAIGGYQGYAWRHDLSPLEVMQQMISVVRSNSDGPLLFVALYALRPLVLFPATVLTAGAGVLFGPIVGVISTVVGSNLSALIAYVIGRYFGVGLLPDVRAVGLVQQYTEHLRTNSFVTVLTMRFVFLPYDLVNYLAGLLQIDWKAFLLATAIGSLPGTVAFVLAGASLKGDLAHGLPGVDLRVFALSALVFVSSLWISRRVKRREQRAADQQTTGRHVLNTPARKG